MRWIVESSVRLGVVVLVAVAVILAGGVWLLGRAPVDSLPELLPPQVTVQTSAIGLSSHEVEQFLTVPAEYELANVALVDSLTSRSVPGLSSINLTFKPGTDLWSTARQLVSERMAQVPLPVDIGIPPVLIQPLSSSSRAMMIGLSSKQVAPIDMTTLATWRIRPRLLAVPGVANVTIWGQRDREMLVLLDPARLAKQGVTIDQVLTTVGDSMWTSPLTFVQASSPGADGLIDTPNQRLTIQHILPIITSKDLVNVPIEGTEPRLVTVGDVAKVIEDHPLLTGDAVLKKGPGVILVVEKLPGADAIAVGRGVDQAMSELQPGLAGIAVDTSLFRPGTFLQDSLRTVGIYGLVAFLAVSVWIGLAFRSWRVAVLAAASILASLVAACLVLYVAHTTFNIMTFAGLVMALGVIVDDVVVSANALRRRLDQANEPDDDAGWSTIVAEAFLLGRKPLGFTFAAIAIGAVPFFLVPGVAGTLSKQTMIAYLVALIASAAVAAIVAPALTFVMRPPAAERRGGWLARGAEAAAHSAAVRPGLVALLTAVVVVASAVVALTTLPRSYVPGIRDGSLVIHWQAISGTSLEEMKRITALAEEPVRALPGVTSVTSHVGQALAGDQLVGSDAGETWINLAPNADYDATVLAVNRILNDFPGLRHTVDTYSDSAIARASNDATPAVRVRVYGSNLDTLRSSATKVQAAIANLPGIANTRVATSTEQPLIQIETDINKAARYGLKPGDVRRQAAALVAGIPVGSYYKDQQVFEVSVWSDPSVRQNPKSIEDLPITAADGTQIPLKAVATVSLKPTFAVANHEKASRFLDVSADVRGASAGSVVAAARKAMTSVPLPLGYHAEVSSALAARQQSTIELALIALAVVIGVFLLLQAALQSWRAAALLIVLIPFSVSGSVLAAAVFGWGLSIGVVGGMVAVLVVALRNMTMLVHRFGAAGDLPHAREEIRRVSSITGESALPVITTALATAIAVLPFVVLGNVSGTEVLRPLATVVIAGLITSTILTLLLVPAVYGRWGVGHARRKDIEGAQS